MSQEQPRRAEDQQQHDEAIKYGEVFNVSGELAWKPITPRDAATVQSVETQMLGETRKGGPAALMESAAARNQRAGAVTRDQVTNLARNEGVTISEEHTNDEGGGRNRVITETLAGQVVGQFAVEDDVANKGPMNIGDEIGPTMDADAPATMQAPQVKAITEDHDFIISTPTLNPRLSRNQDGNTLLSNNVSTDNRVTSGENPNVITSSVPGGMGASMATAEQRLTKNK